MTTAKWDMDRANIHGFIIEYFDTRAQSWRRHDRADSYQEAVRLYWDAWKKYGSRRVKLIW